MPAWAPAAATVTHPTKLFLPLVTRHCAGRAALQCPTILPAPPRPAHPAAHRHSRTRGQQWRCQQCCSSQQHCAPGRLRLRGLRGAGLLLRLQVQRHVRHMVGAGAQARPALCLQPLHFINCTWQATQARCGRAGVKKRPGVARSLAGRAVMVRERIEWGAKCGAECESRPTPRCARNRWTRASRSCCAQRGALAGPGASLRSLHSGSTLQQTSAQDAGRRGQAQLQRAGLPAAPGARSWQGRPPAPGPV